MAFHAGCVIAIYLLLYRFGAVNTFPSNINLTFLDAEWYAYIKSNGYYYVEGGTSPMAFFPLFPFLWFVTGLTPVGISIVNCVIFYSGFYFLALHFNFDFKTSLLFLSTPSLFFCFIPYSEALFFFGASMLLVGLDKQQWKYIITGLIIAVLTRSVGMVFIGAIVFVYLVQLLQRTNEAPKYMRRMAVLCSVTIGATLLVFFVQYLYTDEWFVFFKVQNAWNRSLQLPTLPFTSVGRTRILWLDGLALLVCIMSFSLGLYIFCRVLVQKKVTFNPSMLFSIAYLAIMGLVSVFYSGIWWEEGGTSLMSTNRFVFATAFFVCFANGLLSKYPKKMPTSFLFAGLVIMVFTWLMLGAYHTLPGQPNYWVTLTYFVNMSAYVLAYTSLRKFPLLLAPLYIINIFVMVILLNSHIHNFFVA
ncbi:hypothetical protein EDD80_12312 [Anseongella ginsenosidimutans]|uniref:Mannosyltransferase PIG-V n=2 Tax=Anseongella ginsenosidimutans TaxID=496056 RepID=A0A4R3KLJ7_9SPHI|nr:hypothetical protein EDD80_12312 [Anseongella ginsenosidimutans]